LMDDAEHQMVGQHHHRHHHHHSHTGPVTLKVPGHPQVVRPFYPPRDRIRYDSWDGRFE
jgi:hypothetical protein